VLILLLIVMVRLMRVQSNTVAHHAQFPARSRLDHPSRHHPVAIAIPSFRLLFLQLDVPKPDLTVKATGKQWYWSYNYPITATSNSTR